MSQVLKSLFQVMSVRKNKFEWRLPITKLHFEIWFHFYALTWREKETTKLCSYLARKYPRWSNLDHFGDIFLLIFIMTFFFFPENYHWWWRSFFVSGGSAIYVLAYSVFYFYTKLDIDEFVPTLLYFTYTLMMVVTFWLLTGTIGFYAAFFFIRKIYAAVKIDWRSKHHPTTTDRPLKSYSNYKLR